MVFVFTISSKVSENKREKLKSAVLLIYVLQKAKVTSRVRFCTKQKSSACSWCINVCNCCSYPKSLNWEWAFYFLCKIIDVNCYINAWDHKIANICPSTNKAQSQYCNCNVVK